MPVQDFCFLVKTFLALKIKNEHRGFATIEQTKKKYRLGWVGGTIYRCEANRFREGRGLALAAILHNELMVLWQKNGEKEKP
jgi:hypothetical protein